MGALWKELSEPHGFESQVSAELRCHHGRMKVWKCDDWKHRVFPLSPSCQRVLEITHSLGPMQLDGFVSDLWPDFLNNFRTWPPLSSRSRRFNSTR